MEDGNESHLCGGVFFFLLMQTMPRSTSARDHKNGISDDHSDSVVMRDLIYAFTGSRDYGTSKDTSMYKNCQSEGSVNIPFNDRSCIDAYDDEVRYHYKRALRRMCEFVERHTPIQGKREWFVKACLDLISHDPDIKGTDEFCIMDDGSFVSESEMEGQSLFDLQPFIIGLLHYILRHRAGENMAGVTTLDAISKQEFRRGRDYTGGLGSDIKRKISVELCDMPPVDRDEDTEDGRDRESVDDDSDADGQKEAVEPEADTGDRQNGATYIQHQTNVVQTGAGSMSLTINGGSTTFNF